LGILPGLTANLPNGNTDHLDPDGRLKHTWQRWLNNILLGGLNIFLVRFLFPVSTIGIAALVEEHRFGLLNNVSIYPAIEVVLVFIIIDLAV